MLNTYKNSPLVERIMEYTKSVQEALFTPCAAPSFILISAYRYFKEVADDKSSILKEEKEAKDILTRYNVFSTQGFIIIKKQLRAPSFRDEDDYTKIIMDSKEYARVNNDNVLTLPIILNTLFSYNPSGITDKLTKISQPNDKKNTSNEKANNSSLNKAEKSSQNKKAIYKNRVSNLTKRAKWLQDKLSDVIYGQDNAISIFTAGYFNAQLNMITKNQRKGPKATFLFAGPPGVGKTFLAQKSAELLEYPFMRFDMSEYTNADGIYNMNGINKSYKASKPGVLTSFVDEHPACILLFDEIEKANINVIYLFLQILDAGRLFDNFTGKEVDFSRTIIIFTTNAGRKIYEQSISPDLSSISRKVILKALEDDVDPKSGKSVFPAAICSRFATGNVIMFNHMQAYSLRKIAKSEIEKSITSIENNIDYKISISENVYSSILFAQGGSADARTMKSRAGSFINNELYELFRLVSNSDSDNAIENIKKIKIDVKLGNDEQINKLFSMSENNKGNILSFGKKSACSKLTKFIKANGYNHIIATKLDDAFSIIKKNSIDAIFCDIDYNKKSSADLLNIEDVIADGRTFLDYINEETNIPTYVLSESKNEYSIEEKYSLMKNGSRGLIFLNDNPKIEEYINEVIVKIGYQKSMMMLAKSNKMLTYETSQTISKNGKIAKIQLYNLELKTNVDANDTDSLLNSTSRPTIKFNDIVGANDAKEELKIFVEYLKNPSSFIEKGLGTPRGVLFYGPPGTGKTMLAKAVAGESDVTFISTEGNRFIKQHMGEGEQEVHKLFSTARKYAPTIIFIDEFDAIAKERAGLNSTSESILTAFLTEMDGFKTDATKPVFVLAATNYDIDPDSPTSIDPAITRRFDRSIYIDLPNKNDRIEYINSKAKNTKAIKISDDEIESIATRSIGMSLAELENVFDFALRLALREGLDTVNDEIFEEAFEAYNYGEAAQWDISQLKQTAYHEAGHALICWCSGENPSYLTIVARGEHGGYMMHDCNELTGSFTKAELLNRIRVSLGGRASELVFFGKDKGLTTGPSSDLMNATNIAKAMICYYGMDDSLGMAVITNEELLNSDMAQLVRQRINKILSDEMQNAIDIIEKNKVAVDSIVDALLKNNYLSGKEIDAIFSKYINRDKEC